MESAVTVKGQATIQKTIRTPNSKPTEGPDGRLLQPTPSGVMPTSPKLSSDPARVSPVVTKTGP